jgi:hypothetical protein
MRCPAILAALLVLTPAIAASAEPLTAESLVGLKLHLVMHYDMRIRREQGTFDVRATADWRLRVEEGGVIAGEITRTTTTPRGPRSRSHRMRAKIGSPADAASGSGHALWILQDNKLTLLRTFSTGGFKADIAFIGQGADMKCAVHAPFVREEGAGNTRRTDSIVGGPVEIISAVQKSTSCRLSR